MLINHVDVDESDLQEPPETPAPLFAVRAFKTAIFGMPGPTTKETYDNDPLIESNAMGDVTSKPNVPLHRMNIPEPNFSTTTKPKPDVFASPAKGILLTPGTGAVRRKTVSFGTLAASKESTAGQTIKNDGMMLEDSPATSPSKSAHANQSRQTSLNKKLFETRDGAEGAEETKVTQPIILQTTPPRVHVDRHTTKPKDTATPSDQNVAEGDVTMDLKDPRSRSGRHWKREYTRYHEKSDHEMRKLIKYSQIAKSYAVKRDAEALNISEKLKKALSRVAEMEGRVSELAGKLAENHDKADGAPDQAHLMAQLAIQTAQALRYKQKAEKYEKAIREHNIIPTSDHCEDDPETEDQSCETPQIGSSKMPDPEPTEVSSLRSEVIKLRSIVGDAEEKVAHLENQNLALKNNILRVKEEMKKYEARHRVREERRKQSDEKSKAQRRKLELDLAQCRAENEKLAAGHNMEPARQSEKSEPLNGKEEKGHSRGIDKASLVPACQEELVENLQTQIRVLKEEAQSLRPDLLQRQQRKVAQDLRQAQEHLRDCQIENAALKLRVGLARADKFDQDTGITDLDYVDQNKKTSIWTDAIKTNSTSHGTRPQAHKADEANDNNTDRVRLHALKELDQNNVEQQHNIYIGSSPQRPKTSEDMEVNKNFKTSTLRTLSPTEPQNSIKDQQQPSCPASAQPSLLGFTPDPPKPLSSQLPLEPSRVPSDNLKQAQVGTRHGYSTQVASSRIGSVAGVSGRSLLPPDRAAAARLRLEQRKAEKQPGQGNGKENSREKDLGPRVFG